MGLYPRNCFLVSNVLALDFHMPIPLAVLFMFWISAFRMARRFPIGIAVLIKASLLVFLPSTLPLFH